MNNIVGRKIVISMFVLQLRSQCSVRVRRGAEHAVCKHFYDDVLGLKPVASPPVPLAGGGERHH